MSRYVVSRIAGGIAVLLVISALVFAATNLLPGNPAYAILGRDATPDRVKELTQELSLDQPLVKRYVEWLGGAVHGDFGRSITQGGGAFGEFGHGTKVGVLVLPALWKTVILASISLAIVIMASLFLGVITAVRQ